MDHIHLFTYFHTLGNGKEYSHKVFLVPGYGITVPSLLTTNGSAAYTARMLSEYAGYYPHRVVPGTIDPGDITDLEGLKKTLLSQTE